MIETLKNLFRIKKFYELVRSGIKEGKFKDKQFVRKVVEALIKIKETKEMIAWLQGKKTYVVAILIGSVYALHSAGMIDDATRDMLLGLLGAGAIATVRAAISKVR